MNAQVFKNLIAFRPAKITTYIYLCQNRQWLAMQQGGVLFQNLKSIDFHVLAWWGFCFIWKWWMRLAAIAIYDEFNLSIKPSGRRLIMKLMLAFLALCLKTSLNFHWTLRLASVKAHPPPSWSWKIAAVSSLSKKLWGRWKENCRICSLSLPIEGGRDNIYQFLSFSAYFWHYLCVLEREQGSWQRSNYCLACLFTNLKIFFRQNCIESPYMTPCPDR